MIQSDRLVELTNEYDSAKIFKRQNTEHTTTRPVGEAPLGRSSHRSARSGAPLLARLRVLAVGGVSHVRCAFQFFASRPYLLQLLSCLLRFHSMEVGDQIATSSAECVDLFLQFLLDQRSRQQNVKLAHHWTEFIFHCVQTSHKMRYQLGQEAIITVLRYDETTLNDVHCRFLCCFLKDVHGRAWLRESGGLDRILWRLATPDQCGEDLDLLRLQQIVVADLGSVLHDHALLLTINHPNFLPTAIAQINRFLEENSEKCKIVSDRHALNVVTVIPPMSEDFCEVEIVEKSVSRKRKNDEPLCKDFNTFCWPPLQSPAASPPSARRFAWSPSMSPSTSSAAYDQYMSSPSASPPSDNAQFQLDDYLKEE
uniref:Uncharacterized protein n=1 Tax=Globodera rostochiensis TaxID=31243 RepID=A0A914I856_GLORO